MVTDRKYLNDNNDSSFNEHKIKNEQQQTPVVPTARGGHSKKPSADFRIIEENIKSPSSSPSPE